MNPRILIAILSIPLTLHCSEPKTTDTAIGGQPDTSVQLSQSCAELCSVALTCSDAENLNLIFGDDQSACEATCEGDMSSAMKSCAIPATQCSEIEECSRSTSNDDIGICEGICDLAASQCNLTTDADQCNIDCSMLLGGFGDPVYGADLQCWNSAISDQDCNTASECIPLFY